MSLSIARLTEQTRAQAAELRANVDFVFKNLIEEKPSIDILLKRIEIETAYIKHEEKRGFAAKQSKYHLEGLLKYKNHLKTQLL